ncbi:MAG: sugar transferase [Phycisphaerae bacterium]|nr:sugar transferase [Phycisphaerae bacterium]
MSAEGWVISKPIGAASIGTLSEAAATGFEAVRTGRRNFWVLIGRLLWSLPQAAWVVIDLLCLWTGIWLGTRLLVWWPWVSVPYAYLPEAIFGASLVVSGMIFGWYERETLLHRSRIAARSLLSIALATGFTYIVIHVFMYAGLSRRVAAGGVATFLILGPAIRLLAYWSLRNYPLGLLIIGTGPGEQLAVRALKSRLMRGYRIVGFVDTDPDRVGRIRQGYRVLGTVDEIERICLQNDVHEVVIGSELVKRPEVAESALACLRLGCRVTNEVTFCEKAFGEVPVEHIGPDWFLFADLQSHREEAAAVKRIADVITAVVGLILSLPLWPLIALLAKLASRGPVFYSQQRVGQNGRIFTLYKFRTMCPDAEADGSPTWAVENDPRVNAVGRFLRGSRLDELPQLWNILFGHMSLVGPRPERPEFVEQLRREIPFYNERLLIKPGLTGWAQINFRYGASVEDTRKKLQLDLYYIKHMGVELDLIIMLRTFGTFFQGAW